jgi:hypothetical protein
LIQQRSGNCGATSVLMRKIKAKPMKNPRLILEQYKKAQYFRNVCKYNRNEPEEKYWSGYLAALSLILETQK